MMHTGRELLRLLKANGFEVVSVRGSHYKMRHADGRWLTFPFCERQYPKGTYFNVLKLAGLRPSDIEKRENIEKDAPQPVTLKLIEKSKRKDTRP